MAKLQRKKTPSVKKKKSRDLDVTEKMPKVSQKTGLMSVSGDGMGKNSTAKSMPSSKSFANRKTSEPGKIRALWNKTTQFLREVKIELKKVSWPSRKQTVGSTLVVLILVLIISFFLGAVDVGLAGIIRVVLQ